LNSTAAKPGQPAVNFSCTDFPATLSANRLKLILCALLAIVTATIYSPIIRAPFLNYDDGQYVSENVHVRSGISWVTVKWAFASSEASNWHPVTWLSHALDRQLFGLSPVGSHAVNLAFHVTNALLLFMILQSATGFLWRSFGVAALFALHPINVESVAWISERKDVLSMFFFLVALAAYGWYARGPSVARYLAVTVVFALALMSKPQVITFPFCLLLLDYWPLRRLLGSNMDGEQGASAGPGWPAPSSSGHGQRLVRQDSFATLVLEKLPWFALSLTSAIITRRVEGEATQASFPLWVRLANAALAYAKYVGKAIWPFHLALVYPHPGFAVDRVAAAGSAIAILCISIFVLVMRQHRPFLVGWFWFLGTLVPMIGLIQIGVQSMADRYAYIPFLGFFVIMVWGAAGLAGQWHLSQAVVGAGSAAYLVLLAVLLSVQVGYWRDNVTLWTHTLAITQGNYTAEDYLAAALIADGKIEEAVPHLQRAIQYNPEELIATVNLATYFQMHGKYPEALAAFARIPVITKNPGAIELALLNSGYAHMSLKQYDNAKKDFAAVLQMQSRADAFRGLGLAEQRSGDLATAVRDYQSATQLEPSALNLLLLAQAYEATGQNESARAARAQAAILSPNLNTNNALLKRLLTE
jgi:protein O-mannosyl-transferase